MSILKNKRIDDLYRLSFFAEPELILPRILVLQRVLARFHRAPGEMVKSLGEEYWITGKQYYSTIIVKRGGLEDSLQGQS